MLDAHRIIHFFALRFEKQSYREVSEWLKEHAWKVCIPLKGIEGSNPFLSANASFLDKAGFFIYGYWINKEGMRTLD